MAEGIRTWQRQLIDLGGRNNLLYYRDLRAGTLDLAAVSRGQVADRLFSGKPVRLSHLFTEPDARTDATKRARALRAKAIENDEERGLHTLYVGVGLATWTSERSSATPNSPVVLYRLTIRSLGVASEDFELELDPEPEVNPTLLHLLETDFKVRIDADELLEHAGDQARPDSIVAAVRRKARGVPGFDVTARVVIGNFSYAKLPMVRDLERSQEQIEQHSLLAAITGDIEARAELRERHRAAENLNLPVVPPPDDEYLILDADSSQSRVIASVVAGADLVVIGPPGTGKSQTIANLVATLIARGRSVLFVAEKRAAIEAVVDRLQKRELGDLIFDLHDGASNRRRVAAELGRALAATGEALAPDVSRLHRQLGRRRGELEGYADQLHEPVSPWEVSAFEVQQRLIAIPDSARVDVRFRGPALKALTPAIMADAGEDVRRFVELGGPTLMRPDHPWNVTFRARAATTAEQVTAITDALYAARQEVFPQLRTEFRDACHEAGLQEPPSLQGCRETLDVLESVHEVLDALAEDVFALPLDEIVESLAPAGSRSPFRMFASLAGDYRRARRSLRESARTEGLDGRRLLGLATTALEASRSWDRLAVGDGTPTRVDAFERLTELYQQAVRAVSVLSDAAGIAFESGQQFDELEVRLERMEQERPVLTRLPELHQIEDRIRGKGVGPLLDEVVQREFPDADAASAVDFAWLTSILDRLSAEQPALAAFDSEAHGTAVREFAIADRAHIDAAASRVRRAWAERAVRARDEYPDEASQVAKQANLKRRHLPIRDLFDRAEHVLTAVKPCWVMSPLVVAQVLPSRPCFDVVIFDEASQIPPADAACSLLRGRRAVVAGDPHQLPPTTFFSSSSEDADDDQPVDDGEGASELETNAQAASLTRGQESILDVMRSLLPPPRGTRVLNWHYRSQDERLITFSNAQESLYDWSLTTFPGALSGPTISHVLVPFRPGVEQVTASVSDEVNRVVELIIEHVRERPEESLGVIALGSAHAERISEVLRRAAADDPEFSAVLDGEQDEPLFVKNLERVQGDERDAIILTVGYGKTADGRMRYQFGPITHEGGQRRLNVAITRARRRMTVVSSFSGREMDPERLRSVGAQMLRDYLLYAESGGTNLGLRARPKPVLNPFERDVLDQLSAHGIPLEPQFGASGYWIDFVAMHPERRSEPVLAIEADGAMYHSAPSARDRDRLRQEHLERLGWRFHRIWSTDWFRAREQEITRAVAAYQDAVAAQYNSAGLSKTTGGPAPGWLPVQSNGTTVRDSWPGVPRGRTITDYSSKQLRAVVRWVKSDGRLYTEDELLTEVMETLGFRKRGSRIRQAIGQAIEGERSS